MNRILHGFLDYQSSIKGAVLERYITSVPISAVTHACYKTLIIAHRRCVEHG